MRLNVQQITDIAHLALVARESRRVLDRTIGREAAERVAALIQVGQADAEDAWMIQCYMPRHAEILRGFIEGLASAVVPIPTVTFVCDDD